MGNLMHTWLLTCALCAAILQTATGTIICLSVAAINIMLVTWASREDITR